MNAFVPLMIQRPVAQLGPRLRCAGVGSGVGFGQSEAPQLLAACERNEILLLLRLGAEQDRTATRPGRRAPPSLSRPTRRRVRAPSQPSA